VRLLFAIAAVACTSTEDAPPASDGQTDGIPPDTGTPIPSAPLSAECVRDVGGNALRASCAVHVDPAAAIEISFAPADGSTPPRVQVSDAIAAEHQVPLYFMRPDTEHTYTVTAVGRPEIEPIVGTFTTGGLPLGADLSLTIDGTSTSPYVGFVSPCIEGAYVIVVETVHGEVVWYENFSQQQFGLLDAASFTEDRTILALADGGLHEAALDGTRLLDVISVEQTEDEPIPQLGRMHHDVFRKDGRTYAIFQEVVVVGTQPHFLDGFYVFDAEGSVVAEWHLADHFVPADNEGDDTFTVPMDTSHANAVWVADDGTILFSMRHLSGVLAIAGVDQPNFGEVLWRLSGDGGELGTDFALTTNTTGPASFVRQHNVHFLPDGRLTMFDNRDAVEELSRVIDLTVDPVAGTAVIEREYVLPLHCDYQGGAWRTGEGYPLATCAPHRDAYEFDPAGATDVTWSIDASCQQFLSTHIPRFVPLDW
jgi:hypothetical protein